MILKSAPELWFDPVPWIDGKSCSGTNAIPVCNPATGELIALAERADEKLLNLAIEGAVKAFAPWSNASAVLRGGILKLVATLILEDRDRLARLLTLEQGKPYAQALGEVQYAASFFQWFGEEARRVYGRIAPHADSGREYWIEKGPAGVAGLITPWNFPLAQGAKKIAAALAAGCTAVWKPAERTPLIALAMGPLLREAGLPDGVLQIVPAPGRLTGRVFADHRSIRVLSLTGSTATGSDLMVEAARGIKRVSLELGGNAPFIVLPDADIELAAEHLVRLKLFVSGQVCVTANRVFVPSSIESTLVDAVAEKILAARVGNGLWEGIDAGPLIHAQACQGVDGCVDSAIRQGAQVVCRNQSYLSDASLQQASFYPPTVLRRVQDDMSVACDEVFGPVIPILTYEKVPEAIRRANATPYGLAAYVYGRDLSLCRAVASSLQVGIVGVNEWRPLTAEIPFGGVKASGIGAEGGEEGLHEFLSTRVISMPKPSPGSSDPISP
ncbi:MAG: aldehyde dehydrogenase family protein [Pirellula sp.]